MKRYEQEKGCTGWDNWVEKQLKKEKQRKKGNNVGWERI